MHAQWLDLYIHDSSLYSEPWIRSLSVERESTIRRASEALMIIPASSTIYPGLSKHEEGVTL